MLCSELSQGLFELVPLDLVVADALCILFQLLLHAHLQHLELGDVGLLLANNFLEVIRVACLDR